MQGVLYLIVGGALGVFAGVLQSRARAGDPAGPFYASLTAHGQLLMLGFAVMVTIGVTFYVLRRSLARDLHSPAVAGVCLWLLNIGMISVLLSWFGGFGAGWASFLPLAFFPADAWPLWATGLFLFGQLLLGLALLLFALEVLMTVFARGQDGARVGWGAATGFNAWSPQVVRPVPIAVVGSVSAALLMVIAAPAFLIYVATGWLEVANPLTTVDSLSRQGALWVLGHPIGFMVFLPLLGLLYEHVAGSAARDVDAWAYRAFPLYLLLNIAVLTQYVATDVTSSLFLNPLAQGALVAMIIPGAMTFATVLNYLLGAKMTWSLSASFLIAGLVGVALGGLLGTASALPGVGNVLAGTLVVSAHVHLTTLAGTVLMLFGALYMLIPQGFGWLYSRTLGWMHLGASVTGALGFALLLNLLGFEGMPRALAAISQPPIPGPALGLFFGVTFGIGQLLFLANLLLTAYRAPRPSEAVAPTH